jgi:phosphohistidine swiveling domain-containing protein
VWLHDLARADERCGGKAAGLARLIAAGLPVPPGFAIDGAAFEEVARLTIASLDDAGHALADAASRIERAELPELERELHERAALLGPHVIVRSSASFEDGVTGTAAGVLESIRDPADVWTAVRAVWTSALTPLAVAYARERAAAIRVGVIVQQLVPGELVTIYTRPPGQPHLDEQLVQRGDALVRESRTSPSALGLLALAAEAAIGATAGADVELVGDRVVQARPIVHPVARERQAPPAIVLAPLRDGRTWTWDVTHNPDPLSPAQAGLVARVAGLGAYELRVCGGYLYSTPRDVAPPATADVRASAAAILARLDAELAAAAGTLDDVLDRYVRCYAIWADLAPLVAEAKSATHRPSSVEATLSRAARGELDLAGVLDRIGDLAPAWDVAVPSFRELPGVVAQAIERAIPIATQGESPETFAADLAERDDLYFARMQQLVRRALLERSSELGLEADDIFWISLDDARTTIDRDVAHRRASAARAASARAAAWDMPFVVGGAPRSPSVALRGIGSGPRVIGRAVRFATLAGARFVGAGDVVVVRAVTPALAMFVGKCAAIVSETGGLLDHGAALARELGITCVVGCHDAWHEIADGAIVTVDGAAGVVYAGYSSSS